MSAFVALTRHLKQTDNEQQGVGPHRRDVRQDVPQTPVRMNPRKAARCLDRPDDRSGVADLVLLIEPRGQVGLGGVLGPADPPQPPGRLPAKGLHARKHRPRELLQQGVEEDRVSAMSAAMLSLGERISSELGRAGLEQVYIKGDKGSIVLTSVGTEAVLTVLGRQDSKVGLIFLEMRRAAEDIVKLVG